MLSGEFPHVPMSFLDTTLSQAPHLFPAYRLIEEAERNWTSQRAPPYQRIKSARKINPHYLEKAAQNTIDANSPSTTPILMLALRELQASRRARLKTEEKLKAEAQAVRDEEENIRRAEADGTMTECGCCFGDFPLNRMVHCNSNSICHWFCRGCARQTAETEIGNSKYELHCMSMDGCSFGFSRDQKNEFLDEKTMVALDRNEQEAMLRMAGIENLETCPFCPFAAEYPPVEEDRLFRCQAPDCEMVSCRLCRLESHIPKTCEENAKDNGLSARRLIEEAMSAALIRKCNKCSTPFVKIDGCNKMTCTRGGCFNVQCYVCSKSCSYDHFDDRSRGGKAGNCPLFENVDQRHDQEVEKAEKEALAKVRAEHPEFSEDDLKVKVSEVVRRDEEIRKNKDPRIPNRFGHPANMPDWGKKNSFYYIFLLVYSMNAMTDFRLPSAIMTGLC
jgi:TRIAD3 protein (E3 ubiquitin-protein ligase RNF216)